MFGMLLFFLVGIDRTETEAGCTIMSLFIQYFTLASVGWMGAEAVLMFQKLIIVFGRITVIYLVTVSFICWHKFQTCLGSTMQQEVVSGASKASIPTPLTTYLFIII